MSRKDSNTQVEVTFTYDVPDTYLGQTNALKKTATFTYKGPDKLWIFVDNATKKIISRYHYTEGEDGADVPTAEGQTKVMIDANINPVIAALCHNEVDYGMLEHTHEDLPNNTMYGHPVDTPPDHTYEIQEIEYDFDKQEFVKPYPWKQPHVEWADILKWRDTALTHSDMMLHNAPADQKDAWKEYRQQLRDVPQTFAGVDPWKITFPLAPGQKPPTYVTGKNPKQPE